MENENFSLSLNAFSVLKANFTSTQTEISDLVEDAEFDDDHPQEIIQRSQHALLSPVARLDQELSWLPELSGTQINEVQILLEADRIIDLKNKIEFLPDLPKVNILAHLCGYRSADETLLQDFLHAWNDVDLLGVMDFLNSQRLVAGFPQIEINQFEASIKSLQSYHARSAALSVWRMNQPGASMERLVTAELKKDHTNRVLSEFVREYDILSEPHLARISSDIDQQIEFARGSSHHLEDVIREISELLRQWGDVNQPVQLFEQYHGHEEGRSKKIYEKLRALYLELANEKSEFRHAKSLSEVLLQTFPELESSAEVLKGDVKTLDELDKQQKQDEFVGPLIGACEAAKSQISKLKSGLQTLGFGQTRRGIINDIYEAFDIAARDPNSGDAAFNVIRNFAVYINNDQSDPETAFRLINGLIYYRGAKPSRDVRNQLIEERSLLHRNWKMRELERKSGDLRAMVAIVTDMLKYAKGSDRADLKRLKSKLKRKLIGKQLKWLFFGIVAICFVSGYLIEALGFDLSKTSYQPTTTYKPTTTYQPTTTYKPTTTFQPSVQQEPKIRPRSIDTTETMPPVGQGLHLNAAQLRYCVFQDKRLDEMRKMIITTYDRIKFNTYIHDYNSRCSNYRYFESDMRNVNKDVLLKSYAFTADARKIVDSW